MTSEERTALWRERIADYRSSGQRAIDWCEQHGVTQKQLYYWMRKFKNTEAPQSGNTQWISLLTVDESTLASTASLLVHIGSVNVEVKPGFDHSLLADVVKVLKSIC